MVPVRLDWNTVIAVSKTTATMMYMVHPVCRPGTTLHDKAMAAIRDLDAKYVRYLNWHVYPHLAVAALYPPTIARASWDFSRLDAELIPFLEATKGREPVVSFAGIPPWMFKSDAPLSYPEDPYEVVLVPPRGWEPRDPSGEEVAQYFARIASWYTCGGFTDENGSYHHSGYHYELSWWEVLNEADFHAPQQYTRLSDAVAAAVRKVSPKSQILGLSLHGGLENAPELFEYGLDPKHHRADATLEMMAYHFYAVPNGNLSEYEPSPHSTVEAWQYSFFDQAAGFVERVRYIEATRKRLSPGTRVNMNEIGTYAPGDFDFKARDTHIPSAYWNLSAGVFAYLFAELAKQGIDILAQSLLASGPGLSPGNTMLDWKTGKPNARFHALKLLNEHFAVGDRLVATHIERSNNPDIAAQGFITAAGKEILLINKRNYPVQVSLDSVERTMAMHVVDKRSAHEPARMVRIDGSTFGLEPFAVAVVTLESEGDS